MEDTHQESRGRFYVDALPVDDGEFDLPPEEAAHAGGSRRLAPGDILTLVDASGWELTAEVVSTRGKRLTVVPRGRRFAGPAFRASVKCATALPKGAREDILVSKCAELGVTSLVPVDFARSVVKASVHVEKRRARYERLIIEAAKQSGQATLTRIEAAIDVTSFLCAEKAPVRLFGDPQASVGVLEVLGGGDFDAVTYLVGPEGGMTDEEKSLALSHGWTGVRIAPTTLRVETACIAFAAVIATFMGKRSG